MSQEKKKRVRRFKRSKLDNQDEGNMCLYGRTSHAYGDWTEVYREKKRLICKVCKLCTHLIYKDEFLDALQLKKSDTYKITNEHIDLFKP